MRKQPGRHDDQRTEAELTQTILLYLAEHPQAQDTLEGIAAFWVMRQRVRQDVEAVARVLAKLTESGDLEIIKRGQYIQYRRKRQV